MDVICSGTVDADSDFQADFAMVHPMPALAEDAAENGDNQEEFANDLESEVTKQFQRESRTTWNQLRQAEIQAEAALQLDGTSTLASQQTELSIFGENASEVASKGQVLEDNEAENPLKQKAVLVFRLFDNDVSDTLSMGEMAKMLKTAVAVVQKAAGEHPTETPMPSTASAAASFGLDGLEPEMIAEAMGLEADGQLVLSEFVERASSGTGFLAKTLEQLDYAEMTKYLMAAAQSIKDKAQAIFHLYDIDGNGELNVDEMEMMLTAMSESDADNQEMQMFDPDVIAEMLHLELDKNGDGGVDLKEFVIKAGEPGLLSDLVEACDLTNLEVRPHAEIRDKAIAIYVMFDLDNNGTLSVAETIGMIQRMAATDAHMKGVLAIMDPKVAAEQVQTKLDPLGSGVVTLEHFVNVCREGGFLFDLVEKVRLELLVLDDASQKAMDLFQMFDADGNGDLDLEEMTALVNALVAVDDEGYLKDELEDSDPELLAEMLRMEFDGDGDGNTTREEFIAGCTSEDGMLTDLIATVELSRITNSKNAGAVIDTAPPAAISAVLHDYTSPAAEKAREIFLMFDIDKNGDMDIAEMTQMINALAEADEGGFLSDELGNSDPAVVAEMLRMEFEPNEGDAVLRETFVKGCVKEDGMLTELVAAIDIKKIRAPIGWPE